MNARRLSVRGGSAAAARASTLFELVVVLVILAAVAAIAVPRFNSLLGQDPLDRAARQVSDDIRRVRSLAISDKGDKEIIFDTAQQRYDVPALPGRQTEDEFYYVTFDPPLTLDSVDFNSDATLRFNGLGVPFAPGFVRLTDGHATVRLTVSPLNGEVTRSHESALVGH